MEADSGEGIWCGACVVGCPLEYDEAGDEEEKRARSILFFLVAKPWLLNIRIKAAMLVNSILKAGIKL